MLFGASYGHEGTYMYIASTAGKVHNLRLWVSRSYSQKLKQQKRPMIKWKLYLEKFKNHWKSNFTLLSLYLLLQRRSKAFVAQVSDVDLGPLVILACLLKLSVVSHLSPLFMKVFWHDPVCYLRFFTWLRKLFS